MRGGPRGLDQRAFGAARDGQIGGAGPVEDGEGVPYDLVDVRVPGDTGDRAEVESRVAYGEQQGQGVVDAGVAVDDDRDGVG